MKATPFFLTDVALPTFDVYSDLSLVIGWYWNRHWNFAISMTIPLVLQFLATCYKWIQIEKKENKIWSWIPLILQCWPQVRALRIINLDVKNNTKAKDKKKELMREVTSTEPFLEAFPSVMIMTVIWAIAEKDKNFTSYCIENSEYTECPEYNNTQLAILNIEYCNQNPDVNRCAVYGGSEGFLWFFTTFFISVLSCAFGVVKFLQNGPFAVISSEGPLGGIMTNRFILAFFAVGPSIWVKFGFIYYYCVFFMQIDNSDQESKIKSDVLYVSILFGLLVIPNLIFSLVSIGFSTGLNKKFFEIIASYPAALMLPMCTFFVIGPRKLSCGSQVNEQRRHLVLSRGLTIVNMILTWIMGVTMVILDVYHEVELVMMTGVLLFATFFHIAFLYPKIKCCGCNFSILPGLIFTHTHDIHAIHVSQNELRPIKIHDLASNDR